MSPRRPRPPPRRNRRYDDDSDSFDDRYDDQYEDNIEGGYGGYRSRRRYDEGKCCSIPKLAVFFITLGITFGLVFGFVDLDKINAAITNGTGGGNGSGFTGGGSGSDDNTGGSTDDNAVAPYEFMQCPKNGKCCNGLKSNCAMKPNEIMWATVHNANHDSKLVANHEAPLEDALEAGYRGLMLDACLCNDGKGNLVVQFCHLICGIGDRDALEVFQNVNTFLNDNPTEMIMINIEIGNGNPTPAQIWNIIKQTELRQKTYILENKNLPTMGELLTEGKQLLLSKHNGFDCTNTKADGCTTRIFEHHNYVIETEYDFNNIEEIETYSTSCPGTRGTKGAKIFYSMNNFVTSTFGPSRSAADIINQQDFIERRMKRCKRITGYDASIISVDFWQRGDLPKLVQENNILRAQSKRFLVSRFIDWLNS